MFCGSVIQRSTQSGFSRSFASRKFGAVAILSCCGSPVAWHFRHGAAVEENRLRAMSLSLAVRVGTCSGTYGIGCCDSAWKKRTSLRSSLSENENVGIRTARYGRTPLPFVIDARTLSQELWWHLLLRLLITWKAHQDCLLSRNELVTPHAVVLL